LALREIPRLSRTSTDAVDISVGDDDLQDAPDGHHVLVAGNSFASSFEVEELNIGGRRGAAYHPYARIKSTSRKGQLKVVAYMHDSSDGGEKSQYSPTLGEEVDVKVGHCIQVKSEDCWNTYVLVRLYVGDYYGQPSRKSFSIAYNLQRGTGLFESAYSHVELGDDASDEAKEDAWYRIEPILPHHFHPEELGVFSFEYLYCDGNSPSFDLEFEPDEYGRTSYNAIFHLLTMSNQD
jgi:hypothetical protein